MPGDAELSTADVTRLTALAARLEGEGHYGAAKLMRAAVEAMLTRSAWEFARGDRGHSLLDELQQGVESVSRAGLGEELVNALRLSAAAVAEDRLLSFAEVGSVTVCRTCGHISVGGEPVACPTCGAHPLTLKPIPPNYWFDALTPFNVVEQMQRIPVFVAGAIDGLDEETFLRPAPDGGWSLRNIITHLRDAQQAIDRRARLILTEDNPALESLAIFAWATQEDDQPPPTWEIFASYRASRAETVALLSGIDLADWWRTGRHAEFGDVTLLQQASYFTTHELTHLPQINALAGRAGRP